MWQTLKCSLHCQGLQTRHLAHCPLTPWLSQPSIFPLKPDRTPLKALQIPSTTFEEPCAWNLLCGTVSLKLRASRPKGRAMQMLRLLEEGFRVQNLSVGLWLWIHSKRDASDTFPMFYFPSITKINGFPFCLSPIIEHRTGRHQTRKNCTTRGTSRDSKMRISNKCGFLIVADALNPEPWGSLW